MKLNIKSLLFILTLLYPCILQSAIIKDDRVIWDNQTHAAFTSLEFFNGYFYCIFREAKKHWDNTGVDCGVIRLLRSRNGKKWTLYRTFSRVGHDLRDPQLCRTANNKLMITAEDVVYFNKTAKSRCTVVTYFDGKEAIKDLHPLPFLPEVQKNWLWQPSLINDKVCGFLYCPYFAFVESSDDGPFKVIKRVENLNIPTEASVALFQGSYYSIVRTAGNALLGISQDRVNWIWHELKEPIACPKLFVKNNSLYCAGRSYVNGYATTIFRIDTDIRNATPICKLAFSKDCAYPGVVVKKNMVYISYYVVENNRGVIHFSRLSL